MNSGNLYPRSEVRRVPSRRVTVSPHWDEPSRTQLSSDVKDVKEV